MKHFLLLALGITSVLMVAAQDKPKPKSPPATVSQEISSGAVLTVHYSQPSVKGRKIGTDVEPMDGKVWRAGANKATVFETSKDVTVEGQQLPAGKYALFALKNGDDWKFIFNKTWDTWGTEYEKNKANDALTINVKESKAEPFAETLTYTISKDGLVSLLWGEYKISFSVK